MTDTSKLRREINEALQELDTLRNENAQMRNLLYRFSNVTFKGGTITQEKADEIAAGKISIDAVKRTVRFLNSKYEVIT